MKISRSIRRISSADFTFLAPVKLTRTNETAYPIWNTTAGKDSRLASAGNNMGQFVSGDVAANVFDGDLTNRYASYGVCQSTSSPQLNCGQDTGLYLSLSRGPALLVAFRICTADSCLNCDPITVTIEGSNRTSVALTLGSSWTLLYKGSSGLDIDPGGNHFGVTRWLLNSSIWYSSYRILATSKRDLGRLVHYSELELLGYW